ncbi:DUF7504 family protein [Haladaptatus sp. NG-WS-4]
MASRLEFQSKLGEDYESNVTFTEWLTGLKTHGSNLLVTGNVPEETSAAFSRTLFGRGQRTRVLALTDPSSLDADAYVSASRNDSNTCVVDHRPDYRGKATTASTAPLGFERQSFRTELISTIGEHDEWVNGFDPAELRLGFDSIATLPGDDDQMSLSQFLRSLTGLVRGMSGMAHYHLRISDDDPLVDELSPLFDARIELRKRPARAEQRWHVPALDETTRWVEIS